MASTINKDSVISRHESILHSKAGDEVVMISIERGKYFGLNEVGSRVWEIVEQPTPVSVIVSRLAGEYEVSIVKCEESLLEFLCQMADQQIIQVK